MNPDFVQLVLITIVTAATPLLINAGYALIPAASSSAANRVCLSLQSP